MAANAEQTDVLICGSGSAGLCAAMWLSRFGINYKILEQRDGPLKVGQADGVQTRTVEIFDSFGIAEALLKESYHVLEIAFWAAVTADGAGADVKEGIRRWRYAPDKETEVSHQPHVILNQARLNALMIGDLEEGGVPAPIEYDCEVKNVEVDEAAAAADPAAYCVTVDTVEGGVEKSYRAKYVLGCDGAHSIVRRSLGFRMLGDSTEAVWGVMDVYPLTDFPDIRKKAVLNSRAGNLLVIPREGDAMVRFYIELPAGTRVADVTLADLQARARLIFAPYAMDVAETAWWSAYAIGQRRADFFHQAHRVFLTGDACHTHSPKAGQGMNVSLQDGHNIGWKLGMILRGLAASAPLLESYMIERERTATELIEFDRGFTRLFNTKYRHDNGISTKFFAQQFVKAGRYTAGQAIHYDDSAITDAAGGGQDLAPRAPVGMRFPTAQVVRFCDAKAMQLVNALPATGAWYLVVFAGNVSQAESAGRLEQVSGALEQVVHRFTPPGADPDTVIDRVLVLAGDRKKVEQGEIPAFFTPATGKWKMKNLTKVFADDESYNSGHGHAYEAYGIASQRGAIVVVRPDHYVAKIVRLEDASSLGEFFGAFLTAQS
ncbi:FAD binding domain-containing protein [Lasiosphaeria miniovina]|uniref:FAD binding domain-containing protein n=1 Tax=Lasiosphaeria miniovina TaxID=1954250 RepID=A0AA39ZUY4_9PEZI|nr:FAD binding domain-containing protein [Lasiosphaeria miniovina]KAK0704036.1 FAD binding domain-containing protein [Lasiosphaeria miniovina]